MRVFLGVATMVLAGCFGINDQVGVAIENQTAVEQMYELSVQWRAEESEPEALGGATGSIAAGESRHLLSFLRPCEDRLVGHVIYTGTLSNGTTATFEQEWNDGCAAQHITLVLEPERMRFRDAYA